MHFMINLLLYITSTFQLSFNNNRKINKTIRKIFLGGWAFFCLFFFFVRVFCFVFYFVLSFVCLLFVFCLFLSFSLVLLAAWTWVGLKQTWVEGIASRASKKAINVGAFTYLFCFSVFTRFRADEGYQEKNGQNLNFIVCAR